MSRVAGAALGDSIAGVLLRLSPGTLGDAAAVSRGRRGSGGLYKLCCRDCRRGRQGTPPRFGVAGAALGDSKEKSLCVKASLCKSFGV